jgi:ATP-dependent protease HslVU (ClpYQ) peptidase subunit
VRENTLLREKLYERERENELELYNLKERLMGVHAMDVKKMKEGFDKIVDGFEGRVADLEALVKRKDAEIREINDRNDKRTKELNDIIENKNANIT